MFDWSSYQAYQLTHPEVPKIEDHIWNIMACEACMKRCDIADRVSGDLLIDRREVEENIETALLSLEKQGRLRRGLLRGWWRAV